MMQIPVIWVATAAMLVIASLAVTSSAEARAHRSIYRNFGAHPFFSWYTPRYSYAAPYRYYGHINSNLNPDRQMVGIGD